ncbi:hypothetical protein [Enterococcus gallinarum]|uniref:hypothetical protein n=1 Tax=Enterococcus gallinarum TaxID=1353 RepID=UPI00374F3174
MEKEYWKRICLLTAIPDWNKDSEIVTEVERLRKKYEGYRKEIDSKKVMVFYKNNSSYVYDTLKKCVQQEKIPREKILFYSQNDKADKKGRRFRVIG